MTRSFNATTVALVVLAWSAPKAIAGEWDITAGVGVSETYTDNANLASDNEERNSDLISLLNPTIAVRGQGGRVSLDLDFGHERRYFRKNTGLDQSNNTLNAAGRVEIWDRIAFVDATASMSRRITEPRNQVSTSQAGQATNRTDVQSYDISPYFLHHFGTWVETESRTRFNRVVVDSDDVSSTKSIDEMFRANGGRRFTRLQWTLLINRSKTIRSRGAPTTRSLVGDADFTFVVSPKVSLLAGLGYENIDDGTLQDRPKGTTWNAGVNLVPSSRTSLRATFGHRFDSNNFGLDASHRISRRTTVTASYSETLQTSQNEVNQDLSFLGVDANGDLIDSRTGQPFTAGNDSFGLQTSAFRQRVFTAAISGSRRRNTFGLNVSWESRNTKSVGPTTSENGEQIVKSGSANISRRLSRRSDGGASVSFNQTDFGDADGRIDNSLTVQADFSYRIFETTRAVLKFSRTQRRSNIDGNGLTENSFVLTLRQEL